MTSETSPNSSLTRREAIQRTAALLGIALSPALLSGVLQAQNVPSSAAKPVHLTAGQFAAASAVAERILPRTDTPGAIDAGVPAFLDLMTGAFMTAEDRRMFTEGLAEVDAAGVTAHQRTFSELSTAQQDAILQRIATASQARERTFFHQIRELTLIGYFTSVQVGKHVTHYDPIPGPYRGCVPLTEVGNKAWTR
jgi:gluconate 2-dehydrogenase gamma chain